MLKRTPLYQWHSAQNARLAEFAGWEMPIQYGAGSLAEHRLVRRSLGIFDVSHMAQFIVEGDGAAAFLQRMVSADIEAVREHGSTYALLCRPDGGVLDDLFIYRLSERWMIVANAANEEKDFAWLREHIPSHGAVELTNTSSSTAMLAVQGPHAITVLDSLSGDEVSSTPRFSWATVDLFGRRVLLGRTGYTGEDGVELFVENDAAEAVWTRILDRASELGIEAGPVGLAARDSLRFEPGFALYGHELDEAVTPVEARLTWACSLSTDFIGRDAIARRKQEGATRKLATLRMIDRGVPRQGSQVFVGTELVGEVVSGMYAPTVDAYCANAFLLSDRANNGTVVDIEIRGKKKRAEVVKRPLYKPAYK